MELFGVSILVPQKVDPLCDVKNSTLISECSRITLSRKSENACLRRRKHVFIIDLHFEMESVTQPPINVARILEDFDLESRNIIVSEFI